MSTTNYLLRARSCYYSYCIFNHIAEIHSALYLVICFFTIADLLLNSQFLAIVHIIYSGDYDFILFTIMLMNLNKENEVHKPRITRLGRSFLLDNCRFNFGLHQQNLSLENT
jgi:NADH:ubiquinone oxidoreductase subunit 6 (subunit J)